MQGAKRSFLAARHWQVGAASEVQRSDVTGRVLPLTHLAPLITVASQTARAVRQPSGWPARLPLASPLQKLSFRAGLRTGAQTLPLMIQLSADNCVPEKAGMWWGLLVLLLLKYSSNPTQVEAFHCQLAKLQRKYMQIASTSSLINAVIVRTSLLKGDRVIDVGKCNFPVSGAWILTQKPDFCECCPQLEWKPRAKCQTFGPLVTVIVCGTPKGRDLLLELRLSSWSKDWHALQSRYGFDKCLGVVDLIREGTAGTASNIKQTLPFMIERQEA